MITNKHADIMILSIETKHTETIQRDYITKQIIQL